MSEKIYNYTFTVHIGGIGKNIEEAWREAYESFALDPGPFPAHPDDFEVEEVRE